MYSETIAKGIDVAPLSSDLKGIGTQINDAHAEAERALRASVEHAIRAGELLIKAKRLVGRHGMWSQWLQDNIAFSERLAQAYMRLARLPIENRNAVAGLPLREALSAIRSQQKQPAIAEERTNQPPPGAATLAVVTDDGVVFTGADALAAHSSQPASPPAPPPTAVEIADDLINQLVQVTREAPLELSACDLRAAFDRRFGPTQSENSTATAAPNWADREACAGRPPQPDEILAAEIPVAPEKLAAQPNWDSPALGDLSQILKFIAGRAERAPKADRIDAARQILRVLRVTPEELGLNDDSEAAPSSPAAQDDGLDIPAFLCRTSDSGGVS
jgi:Protein of unknown function (DUF3102)